MTWYIEQARLTAFFPPAEDWGDSLWKTVLEKEPETSTTKRTLSRQEESGEWEGVRVKCTTQPGRVDWLVAKAQPAEDSPLGVLLAPSEKGLVAEVLMRVTDRWLGGRSPIRLACGAKLLSPVESRAKGYEKLDALLPAVRVDPLSEDFFFQVNRPRSSNVSPGLRLNRISRWSVQVQHVFSLNPGEVVFQAMPGAWFACSLETDISTDAARQEPLDAPVALWRELQALGEEVAERGDVP